METLSKLYWGFVGQEKRGASLFYKDYHWVEGLPKGLSPLTEDEVPENELSFKIMSDSYLKRFSVERYVKGKYQELIYDSHVYDFRLLKVEAMHAWSREPLRESQDESFCLVRDHDDRVILKERGVFKDSYCVECTLYSPYESILGVQTMSYQELGDAENTALLRDAYGKPVMLKRFASDDEGGFSRLVETKWDF